MVTKFVLVTMETRSDNPDFSCSTERQKHLVPAYCKSYRRKANPTDWVKFLLTLTGHSPKTFSGQRARSLSTDFVVHTWPRCHTHHLALDDTLTQSAQ